MLRGVVRVRPDWLVHAGSIAASGRAELAWVCDPMQAPAVALAARHGGTSTADVDAVLSDPSVDAVVVASSTPTHVDLLTRAVQAGKAVLCEKPIDLDIAKVDDCWVAIKDSAPVVMVGFNRRFNRRFDRSFGEIRTRIDSGEIGSLEQVLITSRDPRPSPAEYLKSSGGLFRDMTIQRFRHGQVPGRGHRRGAGDGLEPDRLGYRRHR